MKSLACCVVLTGFVMTCPPEAKAWDSSHKPAIRHFPATNYPTPFGDSLVNNKPRFAVGFVEDALGNVKETDEGYPNTNALLCSQAFLVNGDISQCGSIEGSLDSTKWGWLEVRKKGNSGAHSEHTLIATASAERAGLNETRIFEPFWLRYATRNEYVASPATLDEDDGRPVGDKWVAAQSWLPTGGTPGSTHAARSMALLELAQLPDDSSSVADFAAGNEICPLDGIDGYGNSHTDACHQFEGALGSTNATHFKPLNHAMWAYYHTLARRRIRQCADLEALNGRFYEDWDYYYAWSPKIVSEQDTEVHECEREAMAYEMFAQHFLQDAWSTGHMWRRWGRASIADFPDYLGSEIREDIPNMNRPARRAAIAAMVAVGAGVVHGAKSVLLGKVGSWIGDEGTFFRTYTDDPLNSPEYQILPLFTEYTRWIGSGSTSYFGGGDLYWNPSVAPRGAVGVDEKFREQRERLLNCGAASMLETYREGPMRHGVPMPGAHSADIDAVDLRGSYCWEQMVDNRSMAAAVGISDATYGPGILTGLSAGIASRIIVSTREDGLSFPRGDLADAPDEATKAAIRDRDLFLQRLARLFADDLKHIRQAYEWNAGKDANGTTSAENRHETGSKITLLGVDALDDVELAPMTDPSVPPEPPPGVPYVDRIAGDLPATASTLQLAIPRLFWRGNIVHTCRATLQDDAALLTALQHRCLANAELGGDADACTECVYRAAPLIPVCEADGGIRMGESMCSEAGAIENAHAAGLPDWWFYKARLSGPETIPEPWAESTGLCQHPLYVALQWCSGSMSGSSMNMQNPTYQQFEATEQVACSDGPLADDRIFGVSRWRQGTALVEPLRSDPDDPAETDLTPYLLPMFTAISGVSERKHGSDPCDESGYYSTSSQAAVRSQNLLPLDLADFSDAFVNGPDIPRCGVQQRISWWQTSCSQAMSRLGYSPTVEPKVRSQLTGEQWQEFQTSYGSSCYIQEPRTFVTACTDDGLTCNAGWQCVPAEEGPVVKVFTSH